MGRDREQPICGEGRQDSDTGSSRRGARWVQPAQRNSAGAREREPHKLVPEVGYHRLLHRSEECPKYADDESDDIPSMGAEAWTTKLLV